MNKQNRKKSHSDMTLVSDLLPRGVKPTIHDTSGKQHELAADCWLPGVNKLYHLSRSDALRQTSQHNERVKFVEGQRPLYDARPDGETELDRILLEVAGANAWNSPVNSHGKKEALYLPDHPKLRNHIIDHMRKSDDVIAIPFAGEQQTIAANANYALEIINDPKRVILSDAGYSLLATKRARDTGAIVINQATILSECID
ncbi:hypothetical protein KBD81_00375, partial [Candidatus Woesebacteria bacterium]|nr:hypothetical protein [Candidatus Woesebacteria bacterium]